MLDGFSRDDLTRALERRRAVQGTLMRSTIHLVSARDYWRFEAGIGPSRREWWLRTWGGTSSPRTSTSSPASSRAAWRDGRGTGRRSTRCGPRRARPAGRGMWIPLVRVPPSGTWERRRADLFRLAGEWLPRERVTEDEGLEHLLRRYLAAFGPSTLKDAATWAGVGRASLLPVAERMRLRTLRDEDDKELGRPPASTAGSGGRPRAGPFPRPLGRSAPGARAPNAGPAGALPRARLLE